MVHESEIYITVYLKNVSDHLKFISKVREISPFFRCNLSWHLCVLKNSNEQESSEILEYINLSSSGHKDVIFSIHETNNNRLDILRKSFNSYINHKRNIIIMDEDCGVNPTELIKMLIEFDRNYFELMGTQHHSISHANYEYQNSNYRQVIYREWIEIGPILILKACKFAEIFPHYFKGMGYGLEFYWKYMSNKRNLKIGLSTTKIIHRRETRKVQNLDLSAKEIIKTATKIADL